MNLVFLGAPGAGKGTQAKILGEALGICSLSTGEMLRTEAASGSKFGQQLQQIMSAGHLVPDDIMTDLIRTRIKQSDCAKGFILDGFPRTLGQAQALDKMLQEESKKLDRVIEIEVDDKILIDRISGRFACAKCGKGYHAKYLRPSKEGVCDVCGNTEFTRRKDDEAETVERRLQSYRRQTEPLLPYYKAKKLLSGVDGMSGVEAVSAAIRKIAGPAKKD
jgi:adenylate kinase